VITFEYTPPVINAAVKLEAVKDASAHAGAETLLEASQPLVPVDLGTLKRSGKTTPDGPGVVAVSYSAISEDGFDYSIKQHEDYTLRHPNGGEAGYLGRPMFTHGLEILAAMAEVARAGMRL
jgi:hypothetical protein